VSNFSLLWSHKSHLSLVVLWNPLFLLWVRSIQGCHCCFHSVKTSECPVFSWQFCNLSVYLRWFGKSTTVLSPCCQAECKVEDRMIFQCTLYCSLLCVLFLHSRTTWDIQLRSWKSHHCWYSEATILSLCFLFFFSFLVFFGEKEEKMTWEQLSLPMSRWVYEKKDGNSCQDSWSINPFPESWH